jgi:tetratricopeptide (TPR) repeat protein
MSHLRMRKLHFCVLAFALFISISPNVVSAQTAKQLSEERGVPLKGLKPEEAEAIWRAALKQDPKNVRAYLGLGDSLKYRRRDREVVDAYQKAIDLAPRQVEGYLALADFLRSRREQSPAIIVYRKAIAVAVASSEIYYMLGVALTEELNPDESIAKAQKDEAITYFRQAIEIAPQSSKAYFALGSYLQDRGEVDAAAIAYRASMDLGSMDAYAAYGGMLEQQNRLEEMVPIY